MSGAKQEIVRRPGFARGLAELHGYLFIGLSLVRDSRPFDGLPLETDGRELICSMVAVELASGKIVGTLRYTGGCTAFMICKWYQASPALASAATIPIHFEICAIDLSDVAF